MLKYALGALLVLFCLVPRLSAQEPMQDVVYLKDGSVIRGQIIEQVPMISLKIQTRDGTIFVINVENITRIVREPLTEPEVQIKEPELQREKCPATAFFLSLLMPGGGQYYNREPLKALVQQALVITGSVVTLTLGTRDSVWLEWDDRFNMHMPRSRTLTTPWLYVGLGTIAAGWIWSMIDAPLSASKINRERRQQMGHLIEFNNDNYALGLDVATKKEGIEAKITLHF